MPRRASDTTSQELDRSSDQRNAKNERREPYADVGQLGTVLVVGPKIRQCADCDQLAGGCQEQQECGADHAHMASVTARPRCTALCSSPVAIRSNAMERTWRRANHAAVAVAALAAA